MEVLVKKNEKTVNEKWKSIKSDYTRQFVKVENGTRKEVGRMKKKLLPICMRLDARICIENFQKPTDLIL